MEENWQMIREILTEMVQKLHMQYGVKGAFKLQMPKGSVLRIVTELESKHEIYHSSISSENKIENIMIYIDGSSVEITDEP